MTDLNSHTAATRETHRKDDGKFGRQEHTGPEAALVETRTVQGTNGQTFDITPGVIDSQAEMAYAHGQCVSLALAYALHHDHDGITVAIDNSNGTVLHAFAWDPTVDEGGIDIHGTHNFDQWTRDQGRNDDDLEWVNLSIDEADNIMSAPFGRLLPSQDLATARTMTEALTARVEEQQREREEEAHDQWWLRTIARVNQRR